jgi:hypothetical protein
MQPANTVVAGQEEAWIERYLQATAALSWLLGQTQGDVPWAVFLPVFEQWCLARGWEVEYGAVEDGSCAIFSLSGQVWDEPEL